MEVPLRTAYGQNGRYGMQPKARQSSRAGAAKSRTKTFELVEDKQKLLNITERKENARANRELLATDLVILKHGQVTKMTPELAPPFLTTTLHQRDDNPFRVTPNGFRDANDNASVRSARDRLIGESGSARDLNHRTMNF
ncbi:hypothetical protein TNCV_4596671 [Trichonephila clavipes]|uniref:Uncharacterized protein n=1 Tax=Trichonephila clavipes TaxID=2585209 RepID=A0A8X6WGI9_TRICX|nr:hypothetical protein TNCV_4596671 [Trichonephila clavipes]